MYESVDRLERNFTASNYSRVPLAVMKAGIKGELDHRQMTAHCRQLETVFKPIDAAIRLRQANARMGIKLKETENRDPADEFLGISQTQAIEGQK